MNATKTAPEIYGTIFFQLVQQSLPLELGSPLFFFEMIEMIKYENYQVNLSFTTALRADLGSDPPP
jgi:hypothetical protein